MPSLRHREFHPLKVLHHVDRLRVLAENKDIAPVTVEIDPVAYCNHACAWCVDPAHHNVTMDDETFDRLITELSEFDVNGFRVEGIVFKGGGEPTLHPRFGTMVLRAVESDFAVGVVTNGSRLDHWGDLIADATSYVRISIDGPTAQSHARIHQSHDFDQIVEGVDLLVKHRGDRRDPVIGLSFAMDIYVIDEAPLAISLGEQLGVDYVLMRPPFYEEVCSEPTMTIQEAQEVRQRLRETAAAYDGPLEVIIGNWIGDAERNQAKQQSLEASGRRALHSSNDAPIEHRTGRCLASPVLAVVTADGHLYGCCNLRALPDWSFGQLDYTTGVGFRQLWEGPQRRIALARMHQTQCIRHCTHPLSRYNEIVEVLRDKQRPHSQFV